MPLGGHAAGIFESGGTVVRWGGLKKIRRVLGRRTRQTEETRKNTWHVAESAGMCAECRGDVSHPAELGQDLLKVLEPNFVFGVIRIRRTLLIRIEIGRFCRDASERCEFCRTNEPEKLTRDFVPITRLQKKKAGRIQ